MVFGYVQEFVSPELTDEQRASVRPPAPQATPWTAPNLMLIRRDSFVRVGPFAETVKVGVTVDWYARALENGLQGVMLPEVVLERRLHLTNNGLRESALTAPVPPCAEAVARPPAGAGGSYRGSGHETRRVRGIR